MLIVLGGLPGVGKSSVARELARRLDAVYVRIDSIERAVRESGVTAVSLDDVGYRAGYAVAADNLRLGRTVIADSVNPVPVTRDAWLEVANRTKSAVVEVEVQCSDSNEHRRRVEQRLRDEPELNGPPWRDVVSRDYRAWDRERIVVDTAGLTIEQAVETFCLPFQPAKFRAGRKNPGPLLHDYSRSTPKCRAICSSSERGSRLLTYHQVGRAGLLRPRLLLDTGRWRIGTGGTS